MFWTDEGEVLLLESFGRQAGEIRGLWVSGPGAVAYSHFLILPLH